MGSKIAGFLCVSALALGFSVTGQAQQIGVGFMSVNLPGGSFEFDVTNETGPNSSLDPTFPITTLLGLNVSNLTVTAADGSTVLDSFGSAYFSLNADGESLDGTLESPYSPTVPANTIGSAVLTGTFATTALTLFDGSHVTIEPGFTATLVDVLNAGSPQLVDQDFVEIFATEVGSATPEPASWMLLAFGLLVLTFFGARRLRIGTTAKRAGSAALVAVVAALCLVPSQAAAAVKLNTWTVASSGVAGTTTVYATGTGFPSGVTPAGVTLSFAATCGGSVLATGPAISVTNIIATTDRVGVLIPAALSTTGNYFVSVAGASPAFTSSNCSEVTVTVPVKFSGACLPSSSIGLQVNSTAQTATAYLPNGSWDAGTTGVQVVPLEPSGSPASIPTPGIVNACSSSPTGQSVCTANTTDVYVITGTTITNTLTSGSNTTDSFSGGSCLNCGVAINPNTNQAVVSMGLSGFAGGYQFINLGASPAFVGPPIGVVNEPTENIVWDAARNLVLSPNESNNYDVIQVGAGASSIAEFGKSMGSDGSPDSAGEDCSTGIAMSTVEFTGELFFSDLTQAVFTPGTPGTWTAPSQVVNFPEFEGLGAGTSGMAVAPGSHLAVVAGEFGGNEFGVVQLPSTSGSGTPGPVDYVQATLPAEPNGCAFAAGLDPHTVTAYTSPNSGKALAVMADGDFELPGFLAVVDMQALLAAPRTGAHTVSSTVDLIGTGILTYVATGNSVDSCGAEAKPSRVVPTQIRH
jgi:hypothetical protein